MSGGNKEAKRISQNYDPNKEALLRALLNIQLLGELPDSDEAIEKWERENPGEGKRLEATIDHLDGEFSLRNSQNLPQENE